MRIIRLPYRRHNLTGRGIGGIFARLLSFAKPVLKSVAKSAVKSAAPLAKKTLKTLGKEALTATTSTLGDVLSGDMTPKEAIVKNAKAGLSNVARTTRKRVKEALENESESSIPIKRARKRKRKKQRGGSAVKQRRVNKRKKKKNQQIKKSANRRRRRPRKSIFA